MKKQTKKNRQSNWITFLAGALLNVFANMLLNNAIHYSLHAVVGGIVFLFFKVIGDAATPAVVALSRSLWKKVNNWVKVLSLESQESKYNGRGKNQRA
jgi:hypothetical protein